MVAHQLLAFWAVATLLILVPGADWAFTVSASARGTVVPAVGGLAAGYTVMTLAVAAGIGALVVGSPAALTVITLAGGCYLVWQGIATLRRAPQPVAVDHPGATTAVRAILQGVGVSGLNPKGLLTFVALLPQFADPHASLPLPLQLAVLGSVFVGTVSVFYLLLGSLAHSMLTGRPVVARRLALVSGLGMVAVGVLLVIERVITLTR